MAHYPLMLAKPGTAIEWSGLALDTLVVADEAEEAAARAEGWRSPHEILNPLDHDGDGKAGGSLPKTRRKAK